MTQSRADEQFSKLEANIWGRQPAVGPADIIALRNAIEEAAKAQRKQAEQMAAVLGELAAIVKAAAADARLAREMVQGAVRDE